MVGMINITVRAMKKSFYYLAAFAALFTACNTEIAPDEPTPAPGKEKVTILASLGKETKTTVDGSGYYSWQADEQISVLEQDAAAATLFDLEDADKGAFSGTKTAEKDLLFAVSPASALTAANAGSAITGYTIQLPASYDNYVPGTTNAVMVGTPNGKDGDNYKFFFDHAAALMKFSYANVPIGTKKFVLTTNADITGTWAGLTSASDVALTAAAAAEAGKTVTLNLKDSVYEANTNLDFYVPVPEANYSSFYVALQDKNGTQISGTNKSKSGLNIDLSAGDILPAPTVTVPAAAKGAEWSYTFTNKDEIQTTSQTVNGLSIISTKAASQLESDRGEQFPKDDDPEITISYTGYVQSVSAVLSCNGTATVEFQVNGHPIQVESLNTQTIASGTSNKNKTYTAKVEGNLFRKGDVKIIITTSNCTAWLKSVTINSDVREEADLSYAVSALEKALGAANFVNPITNSHSLTGITYASNQTDVATVDVATGEVTIVGAGDATITASFAGDELYKAGSASYTIHVEDAYLTLSDSTSPAKADCIDGSTVSFTVTSNVEWTAAIGSDVNSIIKGVATEGNTVTVTFNVNSSSIEKTAQVTVTPVLPSLSALAKSITVTQKKYELVDVINYATTGLGTTGSYTTWSNKSGSVSDAIYEGNSYPNNENKIQLRATDAGIVSTSSGGAVTKVAVTYTGSNQNGRKLSVYGKNTPYSAVTDLYDTDKKGTLIGYITFTTGNTTGYLDITDYYEYVGLWSGDGAMYFSEIDIYWGQTKDDPGLKWTADGNDGATITEANATMKTGADDMPEVALFNPHGFGLSDVTFSSSDSGVATIGEHTGIITLIGEGVTTISASYAGDDTYKPVITSYDLEVIDSRNVCATPTFSDAPNAYPAVNVLASAKTITISCGTSDATIYYTTGSGAFNPSTWTAGSSVIISGATTVRAVAVKDDYQNSVEGIASYSLAGTVSSVVTFNQLAVATGCIYSVSVGGSPIASGDSVDEDAEVTLATTTLGTGYSFVSWKVVKADDPSIEVTVTSNQFTMPGYAVKVYASFQVTDTITVGDLAATSTTYTAFSNLSKQSQAVYAGDTAKGNSVIQMNSTATKGIWTTASAGVLKSVAVEWNTNTAANRTLSIFGSNSEMSSASGTATGSILYTSSSNYQTSYSFTSDYAHMHVRTASNAAYFNSIAFTWVETTD